MKWFKHDTNALTDAKIEKLLMRYGVEGYGMYFAIVEIIASEVAADHFSFTLEHDTEVLAHKFRSTAARVKEVTDYMVDIRLLERTTDGLLACNRLAYRLDETTAKNPEIRAIISRLRITGDDLLSNSGGVPEELRSSSGADKIRLDKNIKQSSGTATPCPVEEIVEAYHTHCPTMTRVRILSDKRKKMIRQRWAESPKHQNIDFWNRYFAHAASSTFLCGDNDRKWTADFEWLINSTNFIKVIEGKYHGKR